MIKHIQLLLQLMRGALGRGKQIILRREFQRNFQKHLDRVRQIRPNTTGWEWSAGQPTLNHEKKHRLMEDKITEIQRENRYLLQRITHTIGKRQGKDLENERMNKSLNYPFRKKQIETIDSENFKLLKRLQEKKSSYDTGKLKEDWKKQKEVIKNIANFPFVLRDAPKRQRRRTVSRKEVNRSSFDGGKINAESDFEMTRIKKINKVNMLISVKLNKDHLVVTADEKGSKNTKTIEIPRNQAMQFLTHQCQNKPQNIFNHLHYDPKTGQLHLQPSAPALTPLPADLSQVQQFPFDIDQNP